MANQASLNVPITTNDMVGSKLMDVPTAHVVACCDGATSVNEEMVTTPLFGPIQGVVLLC